MKETKIWNAQNLFNNWLIVDKEDNIVNIRDNEANAKLIAAAPEMLDMLIEISKNIDENRGVNYMIELMGREYYDKIQNLIKKATE